MNERFQIKGSLLAKNTVLNFIGQVVPLFVAVIAIPFIIRGLGADRFGILSLAWIIIGYFSIINLGLGRATTKFVAEALGKDEIEKIPAWYFGWGYFNNLNPYFSQTDFEYPY